MRYSESSPPEPWGDVVEASWRVEGRPGEVLRVLADGCTDVIALDAHASRVLFVGPMTRAEPTELVAPVTVGLRLRPGVQLDPDGSRTPLSALRDRESVVVNPDPRPEPGAGLLAFLAGCRAAGRLRTDPLVDAMIVLLTDGRETLRVSEACARLGVGERTMERLFAVHVGLSPRRCSRVLRHAGVGRRLRGGVGSIAELAAEHGFADQAHLTRDFGALAGVQPGRFAREARRDGFVQDLAADARPESAP